MDDSKKSITLDRGAGKKKAIYKQIYDHLWHEIKSGKLNEGDKLPTISAMVSHWKVNYRTVSMALDQLNKDGIIKWEGRGQQPVIIQTRSMTNTISFIRWGHDALSVEMGEGIMEFVKEKA
jgi:DNA-binding transcriptional regulator YhcF (GntR family)